MEEQSSRLMQELEQEKVKLELDVDSLQKNQVCDLIDVLCD